MTRAISLFKTSIDNENLFLTPDDSNRQNILPNSTHSRATPQQNETIAHLKDEIQILRKRLESELTQRPPKDPTLEDIERKLKELKEKNRQLILEKQNLQNELEDVTERFNNQLQTWNSVTKQRDSAIQNVNEVSKFFTCCIKLELHYHLDLIGIEGKEFGPDSY